MKVTSLDLLSCPTCHGTLELNCSGREQENCLSGSLTCNSCANVFPIVNGIPHFIKPEQLTGLNRRFSRMYDWFSWGYRAFSKIAFAFIGVKEETGRREIKTGSIRKAVRCWRCLSGQGLISLT